MIFISKREAHDNNFCQTGEGEMFEEGLILKNNVASVFKSSDVEK